MAAFSITTARPSAQLDLERRGKLEFTVTNTTRRDLTARAHVVCEGAAQPSWFVVAGPQRESPVDATHQFGVQVAVPMQAPAGRYRFRLDVVGIEDPDEFEGEGVWATIEVPPRPEPRRIPLWLIALAAVVVIALAVVVYLVFIRQPPQPHLKAAATVQTFGTVPVGQGSPGSVVTVSNDGAAAASVTASIVGLNPGDFKILGSTCAGTPVAAGSSCQLQVGFQPSAQGSRAATLVLRTGTNSRDRGAVAEQPLSLPLSGTGQGTAAAVVFQPASVVLSIPSGGSTVAAVVTMRNNGQTPLKLGGTKLDDPQSAFQLVSACEGATLNGGQTCQVVVLLVKPPASNAPYSARLLVSDDAPSSPQVVPLSGTKAAPSR